MIERPNGKQRGFRGLAASFLACLACLAGPGCSTEKPPDRLQGVILILLDTVRADHLSCYGYARKTTPNLDRLAAQGVRFESAISYAPWTLPSTIAILSAEYPERVYDSKLRRSMVEQLQAAGIRTGAVTEDAWVSRTFGLDLGFDEWIEEAGPVQMLEPGQRRDPDARGSIERTFARARDWLERRKDERFFLLIHTYEPHAPYVHRDFVGERTSAVIGETYQLRMQNLLQSGKLSLGPDDIAFARDLYDGDILATDRAVGSLLEFLQRSGLADRTAIVVTSDHGEELGDHYPAFTGDHGHVLYDSLIRVPLLLKNPLRAYPRRTIAEQARLVDVLPTVADLLAVPPGAPVDGSSLVPLLEGRPEPERVALSAHTRAGPTRVSVRALGHKYVEWRPIDEDWPPLLPEPPERELYDLANDPGELDNLIDRRPEIARALKVLLDAGRQDLAEPHRTTVPDELERETLERLRSLGYLR